MPWSLLVQADTKWLCGSVDDRHVLGVTGKKIQKGAPAFQRSSVLVPCMIGRDMGPGVGKLSLTPRVGGAVRSSFSRVLSQDPLAFRNIVAGRASPSRLPCDVYRLQKRKDGDGASCFLHLGRHVKVEKCRCDHARTTASSASAPFPAFVVSKVRPDPAICTLTRVCLRLGTAIPGSLHL